MKYEVRAEDRVIGFTEFEFGDPPMGFVSGSVIPTKNYKKNIPQESLGVYLNNTLIKSSAVTLEDLTEEIGESCIEITVLIESAQEFEKYFRHHSVAYENQFK